MYVAEVDPVDRRWEKVLFHVARADGSLRADPKRPAMMRSTLVHGRALDALVQGADEEGERSSARMAGASDALGIDLGPCQQIVESAHAIPDAIFGQVLAD